MLNEFYLSLESITPLERVNLKACIEHLNFNENGLIPVITQCVRSKNVLMHAWMNKASIEQTLETGRMTYWSRTRNAFWKKGESSGHVQELVTMRFDCDGDTILCLVKQTGPACHTGRPNCFYLEVDSSNQEVRQYLPEASLHSEK